MLNAHVAFEIVGDEDECDGVMMKTRGVRMRMKRDGIFCEGCAIFEKGLWCLLRNAFFFRQVMM